MNNGPIIAAFLLAIFILAPPIGQYFYQIPATVTLAVIIVLYLPIYYYLKRR
jgi:xanthine/uracil permease